MNTFDNFIASMLNRYLNEEINNLTSDIEDESYDLKTKKGYNDFKNKLDEIKNVYDENKYWFESFGIDKDLISLIENMGKFVYDKNNEEEKTKNIPVTRKEVDHSTEEKHFHLPSESIDVQRKLQLHKLVQEYIDTMIKPYNVNNSLSDEQINDAYAGLFEFGAWILNK